MLPNVVSTVSTVKLGSWEN